MQRKDFTRSKTGRLVEAEGGYLSFVPDLLPPRFGFDAKLVGSIAAAERALGELAALSRLLPNAMLLLRPFLRREAVLSSRIEGTVTRLDELLQFEAAAETDELPNDDLQEVLNYVAAVDHGLARIRSGMPLCLRLLREIHAKLMEGVRGQEQRPGEFRKCPVFIARPGQSPANARFVPPPQPELDRLLADLERFLNKPGDIPIVAQLAIAHYQFESIHPFMDGNGRMGRLLMTLMLCEQGVLSHPLLYLSVYLEEHNDEYRDHLLRVSQRGTWSEWMDFIAVGIVQQARDAGERAKQLLALQEAYRLRMQRASQSSGVLSLVDHLFSSPFLTVRRVRELLGVTHRAATQNIEKLIQQAILIDVSPERKIRKTFCAPEILALLNAQRVTPAAASDAESGAL